MADLTDPKPWQDHTKSIPWPVPLPVNEDGNRLCPQCGDLLVEVEPDRWQCRTWAAIDAYIHGQLKHTFTVARSEEEAERIRRAFGGTGAIGEVLEGDR